MAEKNLKEADAFLTEECQGSPVLVELEKGKLQIKVLQPRNCEEVTEKRCLCFIHGKIS